MTQAADPPQTDLDRLRELLAETARTPAELASTLEQARLDATAGDARTLHDLDRRELSFLDRAAARPGAPVDLRQAVAEAQLAELELDVRIACARPLDDPGSLFDLAEQAERYQRAGRPADADRLRAEVARRLAAIEVTEDVVEEARERFAAVATQDDGDDLAERVAVLRETADVLDGLAARSPAKVLRRMARRARRMAGDRTLELRLERALGRRGAAALESTSLLLLVAVFAILMVESMVELSPATHRALLFVDGGICLFFIAEFAFKLALAPHRASWFMRHVLTDLLPAIPAAMVFAPNVPAVASGDEVLLVRLARFFRITYFARYFRAMQPLMRMVRLLLFLVRGLDGLVHRFAPLLNRSFVFFERPTLETRDGDGTLGRRQLLFRALRREHVLLTELPLAQAAPVLAGRGRRLRQRIAATPADIERPRTLAAAASGRDIAVEDAIGLLHDLGEHDLTQVLPQRDILAIDRAVRVLNAPVVRALPFVRNFTERRQPLPDDPSGRVLVLARKVALYLERWRARLVFFADLHGVVTGPQLLDRVATAMMKASQRPAVRLLLFGALFFVVRAMVGAESGIGLFLKRFVAAPLVILGSVCAVFLSLGWWLKKVAGEASEAFKLTSEAQFISLLDLVRRRGERDDLAFLARRTFRHEVDAKIAAKALHDSVAAVRRGRRDGDSRAAVPAIIREELDQVGMLYLHYLAGSPLHESDVKTTEQLLANPSLECLRSGFVGWTRADRRRLRKLSLTDGTIFGGPYLWFSFITESVAVEVAKRITDYNRSCMTLEQRAVGTASELEQFATWLEYRRSQAAGRTAVRVPAPGSGAAVRTTEFNALDFLSATDERDDHVRQVFGDDVLAVLRLDRERMIREVFGMRPWHRLPRSRRSFNPLEFYRRRLSGGRVLLLPGYFVLYVTGGLWHGARRTAAVVREILSPDLAAARRHSGRAPFAVALRKIHRMKAPGLLEVMRLRAAVDPDYCGAPSSWSDGHGFEARSELERDLDFLHLREHNRAELLERQAHVRQITEELHAAVARMAPLTGDDDGLRRFLRQRTATVVWCTDHAAVRTLWRVPEWLDQTLRAVEAPGVRLRASRLGRLLRWVLRGCRRHPVDRVLRAHWSARRISRRGRANMRAAWQNGDGQLRAVIAAMDALPVGADPQQVAMDRLADALRRENEISRDLCVLRAVQSLTVLDIRSYRDLVFRLGGYADDGEDPALAAALP